MGTRERGSLERFEVQPKICSELFHVEVSKKEGVYDDLLESGLYQEFLRKKFTRKSRGIGGEQYSCTEGK